VADELTTGSRSVDPHYARALDELYWLQGLASYEADMLEAHLSLKRFPKGRRRFAKEQVRRLRMVAEGRGGGGVP